MISRTFLALLMGVAMLAATATAQADSISFVRDGDVWLTTPDHSREHRVTTRGGYQSATQADDGTIFAHRSGIVDRLSRNGEPAGAPVGLGVSFDIDVSPDGSKLAFGYATSDGFRATVRNSDGSSANFPDQNGRQPTWFSNSLVIYSNNGGYINTMVAGGPGAWTNWFNDPDGRKHASAITRAGDKVVVVYRDWDDIGAEFGPFRIAWYSNTSTPPSDGSFGEPKPPGERPTHRCTIDNGGAEPTHPSFSPDGTQIAWEQPDGVHLQPALDLASCTQPPGGATIAGAKSPDWGPADIPTATAPARRCIVPKLKGKTLAKAKRALRRARCKLGKVTRARSAKRPGTVIKQSPAPGRVRRAGSKVRVTLAKRR